jgi:hypothetical protein
LSSPYRAVSSFKTRSTSPNSSRAATAAGGRTRDAELHITLRDDVGNEQSAVAHVNASRRLRDIELAIQADNFTQAASLGHDLVSQLLSRWSFLHDVSITTSAVQIVEVDTRTCRWGLLVIGAVKEFSDTLGVSSLEHRALLSAHREGISSNEPLCQVLSLFRACSRCAMPAAQPLSPPA